MKKYLLLLLGLSLTYIAQAQSNGCDGSRYIDDIFQVVKVTKDIKYGEGTTLFDNFQELYLDVYEPEGDNLDQRPVIILAFGGSFIGGAKEDLDFLCEAYARKGYVAVSIDYRLFDGPLLPLPNADQMKNVVIKTVSDMKAAIRYMRQDAATDNLFRIDSDMVFVGGISAGSITAFHTAMIDEDDTFNQDLLDILDENGGFEGNTSDNFEYSSEVQGLVNFSGGLNDALWIDENDPPFVSIHDDMDGIVPYQGDFATVFGFPIIYMEGSGRCQEVGDSVGVFNQLKTIENSMGHVSYFSNPLTIVENINFTADFVAEIVCADVPTNTEELALGLEELTVFPNPSGGIINIGSEFDSQLQFEMYNVMGKKLSSYSNTKRIDMSNFANGIYILRIIDLNSKTNKSMKVILEK